ncbi:MAG: glutamate--cysteine ligase [Bacillota bacterium]
MKYDNKIDIFVDYFKKSETRESEFKLGIEIEHFIVDSEDYRAISYYENDGIEDILKELTKLSWDPVYEGNYLIGLKKDKMKITLEPGGQIEISMIPKSNIKETKAIYQEFLENIIPILEKKNRKIITMGYQPVSSKEEIPLIPKKRYEYMYNYFKNRGKYSHNMMKSTASIHVNIDYENEIDYIKKYKVASFLSPIIYYMFDNSPFFEGNIYSKKSVRGMIWEQCDVGRRSIIKNVFESNFGYKEYAKYLLSVPSILFLKDNNIEYTNNQILKELIDPDNITQKEIEYLLSMVFPDVRTKNYIEIRMGDALPFPESFGYIIFWKGLMYKRKNLNYIYNQIKDYDEKSIINFKNDILSKGKDSLIFGESLNDYILELFELAESGIKKEEIKYLEIIKKIIEKYQKPKNKISSNLEKDRSNYLKWCTLNLQKLNKY